MAVSDIDFEGTGTQGQVSEPVNNPNNGNTSINSQEDVTHLNGGEHDDITGKDGSTTTTVDNKDTVDNDDNSSTGELEVGDSIDVEGTIYTVAENGDLVDDKGNVFKEAKDVKEWLKSVQVEDGSEADTLNLSAIQDALGVTVTDEQGNKVEFTNDANGVKSYVNSVIELRSKELQEAAVNRLYAENPLLRQFQDYVQLNGTARGFGDIPDRSGIQLDKDNDAQLVAVIKMAAREFGNKSLNDNYIKYLKDTGGLYDEAKEQLAALVDKDNAFKKDLETRAQQQREKQAQDTANYWNNVSKIVNGRIVNGYKIPETFTKEIDGKKVVLTPADFFNYLSVAKEAEDGTRRTGYQRDLDKLTDEEYLHREILDAWLMYTGGTYKDLIDMAVKEDKVRQLRVKSKEQRTNKTVKVIKTPKKAGINDIVF